VQPDFTLRFPVEWQPHAHSWWRNFSRGARGLPDSRHELRLLHDYLHTFYNSATTRLNRVPLASKTARMKMACNTRRMGERFGFYPDAELSRVISPCGGLPTLTAAGA
jgi:hypothetical protein